MLSNEDKTNLIDSVLYFRKFIIFGILSLLLLGFINCLIILIWISLLYNTKYGRIVILLIAVNVSFFFVFILL